MRTERPYPGQLWKQDSIRVIVVAVSPNTVTYEDPSGPAGVTRDSLSNFRTAFTRLKRPARLQPVVKTRRGRMDSTESLTVEVLFGWLHVICTPLLFLGPLHPGPAGHPLNPMR